MGCRFYAGMATTLIIIVILGVVITALDKEGRENIKSFLSKLATFLLGAMLAMSFVGTVLLFKLTWKVESPRPASRQPNIIIHGGGHPQWQEPPPRPALAPPRQWPRDSRQYNLLGEEDVEDGDFTIQGN